MKKKILLGLAAVVVVVGGVAALSAFEAHIINVTAHIENALSVSTKHIGFGTVFPQEMVEEDFTVRLSSSFLEADRVDDVEYDIVQKPKPRDPADWQYCLDNPLDTQKCYPDLCRFLSKLPDDDPENDIGVESYYQGTSGCIEPQGEAEGRLTKIGEDESDTWIVDLKVPPIAGTVGQDWPTSCQSWVVPTDGVDYGCDLWIEVTDISPALNGTD